MSATLKSATQKQHDEAEGHRLHAVMFGSQGVPAARESFARTLGQHVPIQEAFVPRLLAAAERAPWGEVVKPYHTHLEALREDCEPMGVTTEMCRPMAGARRFIERIGQLSEGEAWGLLGVFYVFEGSTNGGTIIAMRVRELMGLETDAGTRFINPHGREVRPRWMKWREDVDALEIGEAERAAVIAGAGGVHTLGRSAERRGRRDEHADRRQARGGGAADQGGGEAVTR
ncbi:MAG: biliverdin-producing heme oxygenase [Phycisphaerales bacterium]